MRAFNAFGVSPPLSVTFTTGLPPGPPTNLRIGIAVQATLRISPAGEAQVESIAAQVTPLAGSVTP